MNEKAAIWEMTGGRKCPACGIKDANQYYTTICPVCGECNHWTLYGSDHRCKCGKAHHWWGSGWRILESEA